MFFFPTFQCKQHQTWEVPCYSVLIFLSGFLCSHFLDTNKNFVRNPFPDSLHPFTLWSPRSPCLRLQSPTPFKEAITLSPFPPQPNSLATSSRLFLNLSPSCADAKKLIPSCSDFLLTNQQVLNLFISFKHLKVPLMPNGPVSILVNGFEALRHHLCFAFPQLPFDAWNHPRFHMAD